MTDQAAGAGAGTFSVSVAISPSYQNNLVSISPVQTTLSFPLVAGARTISSPTVTIGRLTFFSNPNLQANITVWYEYIPDENLLVFCANDLVSPDATRLTTFPQVAPNQTCVQPTYPGSATPCGANPNWNYCTPATPGLQQAFQNTVRAANQAIINAARAQGYNVIVRTPFPPMSENLYHSLTMVLRNGQYVGQFDPAKTYDDGHTIVHPESSWYGEIYLTAADYFANVIGSTGDQRIAGLAWLTLWQNQFGNAASCTSLNFNGFHCGSSLLGGHVILGQTAQTVPAGSNHVFIVPICAGHNNDDTVYMAPVTNLNGIALSNYHNP